MDGNIVELLLSIVLAKRLNIFKEVFTVDWVVS